MSLMWRDPREMFTPLRSVMDRLLEESFLLPERPEVSAARAFPLDISESDDQQHYILEANIAGFKPEEIQITSSGNTITIHGVKAAESKTERGGYVRRERYAGEMSRTVTLPGPIDADKVQATCEQGVLTLTIPKSEGTRPKQISIKTQGH